MPDLKRAVLIGTATLTLMATPLAAQEQERPNILVIWGANIGTWNGRAVRIDATTNVNGKELGIGLMRSSRPPARIATPIEPWKF